MDSLERDAYKLQKKSLKQSEELEDGGTCPQMQAEQTEEGLDGIKECVEEVQETLDRIDGFVHPCEGAGWKEVVNVTYSHSGVECPDEWQDNDYDIKGCGRKDMDGSTTVMVQVSQLVEWSLWEDTWPCCWNTNCL